MNQSSMVYRHCPRCDRAFMGVTLKAAMEVVADHMDKAHPEMQNEVREELDQMEEGYNDGGTTV